MFIRQSKDPDSLPSRQKRRMFRKQERENTGESLSVKYPKRRVLYDPNTLKGKMFNTIEEQEKALESGEWIEHPKMKVEDWVQKCLDEEFKEEEKEKEEIVNWAERLKFRDSNKPVPPSAIKKYPSQMNVRDLIEYGKGIGLDFGTPETCPTKAQMKREIRNREIEIREAKK